MRFLVLFVLASVTAGAQPFSHRLQGPGDIASVFTVTDGIPRFAVEAFGAPLVAPSRLGFTLKDAPNLDAFEVLGVDTTTVDETWQPVWGAASQVRNHYRQAVYRLRERAAPHRRLDVTFRVFADGVGFRYTFPAQPGVGLVQVVDEQTEFRIAQEATAWTIPLDYTGDEHLFTVGPLADVTRANSPVTFRTAHNGTHVVLHEATLVDYPSMTLAAIPGSRNAFRAALVPMQVPDSLKAVLPAPPFHTPWRTLTIGDEAGDLLTSFLILNLNDPCRICDQDLSWLKPAKYVGIWWEIHKGVRTWHPGPNVGATTANAKRYIDFASRHGIPLMLVEGWNEGWEGTWTDMDFTTPIPAYDLREVVRYGRAHGVGLIAHVETGANVVGFEAQMDTAFALYASLGIHAIKTGYVGRIPGHYHQDQRMVRHFQDVVERAARHRIMVNSHESIKSTGLERTWPNYVSREAARGGEYDAWSAGNPPSHTLILPFTRLVAGPMDYTPGIFNVQWQPERVADSPFAGQPHHFTHSTKARQLALYVVILSGVQMITDIPEHYEGDPAFQFLKDVPVTWDETRVLEAEIGQRLVMARRSGADWFLGALTDDTAQTADVPLAFLGPGRFTATLYADGPGAHFQRNPHPVVIETRTVTAADRLTLTLAPGGGAAIHFMPVSN